jgi:hypothetical protein
MTSTPSPVITKAPTIVGSAIVQADGDAPNIVRALVHGDNVNNIEQWFAFDGTRQITLWNNNFTTERFFNRLPCPVAEPKGKQSPYQMIDNPPPTPHDDKAFFIAVRTALKGNYVGVRYAKAKVTVATHWPPSLPGNLAVVSEETYTTGSSTPEDHAYTISCPTEKTNPWATSAHVSYTIFRSDKYIASSASSHDSQMVTQPPQFANAGAWLTWAIGQIKCPAADWERFVTCQVEVFDDDAIPHAWPPPT